jgi:hypothetical protein
LRRRATLPRGERQRAANLKYFGMARRNARRALSSLLA